jgi:hypothetical protein
MLRTDKTRIAMNERATVVRRPATYQDVLDAPRHMVAELVEGALHLHPRPAMQHSRASLRIGSRLDQPFQDGIGGPGGWHLAIEPELHLGPNVLVPDVCGWRRERMPALPDAAWTDLAPDWICELLSPSTRSFDLTDKRRLYAAAGVGHLWFVDPQALTLEAFENHGGMWTLVAAFKDDEEVRAAPFDPVSFRPSELWPN